MRQLIIALLTIMALGSVQSQQLDFVDTTVFVSGAGDTTYWRNLEGKYLWVYMIVDDTGSTYIDSVKAFSITKRLVGTDSVITPINMRNVTDYTDGLASRTAGAVTAYLLTDAYIDRLYLRLANSQFVNARRVKITIKVVSRF